MQTNVMELQRSQIDSLRDRHPVEPDQSWVTDSVRETGWVETNRRYIQAEYQRGFDEMSDLLRELGLDGASSREQAADLLSLAVRTFTSENSEAARVDRTSPTSIRITIAECPTYQRFERQRWLGMTACSSWHRRRGWLHAVGVIASDSVMAERKWGDPACVAEIVIDRLRRAAA